ncbi:hypothetical protein LTR64_007721 [Lithohypha guttulata]|uniref:uncharacterized protein n=1 Tax=Lithohypha guttulata TaxID=1690604 RepID=UPI002DDEE0B7|nr:hypothetical protein LTR51_007230 [Lithohypha guttulata]
MRDSTRFEDNIFYWDGQFHTDGIGYHSSTGLVISHTALGYQTGLPSTLSPEYTRGNPRHEAWHIMLLTLALNGSARASTFIYPANPTDAGEIAASILTTKLNTYTAFNQSFPGYGGFLPGLEVNSAIARPSYDWRNKVSAADNGRLLWAVYALIHVLQASDRSEFQQLGGNWMQWFLYARRNAKTVFMQGQHAGEVCAISTLQEDLSPFASGQRYACEDPICLNNDPYEGELMSWFLYFSSTLNKSEADLLWDAKRPQLLAANYTGSIVDASRHQYGSVNYEGNPIFGRHITPITVQRGLYFGSNEQLKLLFLPYLDVPVIYRVFKNGERVRTCNSMLMGVPGMYASALNGTSSTSGIRASNATLEYDAIKNAGIPSVAVFKEQELDVVTPYSVAPTILFDKSNGLAWYKNMLDGKQMQTVYGSTAATRLDGSAVARFVTWETKAPTLLALLGGIVDIVRDGMKTDKIYDEFYQRIESEYHNVFDDESGMAKPGATPILGENVAFCLPNAQMPMSSLIDFSSCDSTP